MNSEFFTSGLFLTVFLSTGIKQPKKLKQEAARRNDEMEFVRVETADGIGKVNYFNRNENFLSNRKFIIYRSLG